MPAAPARIPMRVRRPSWLLLIAAAVLAAGSAGGAPLAPGDILVTDFTANKLFLIDPDSTPGPPTEITSGGLISVPVGVAVRSDGFAFVTNVGNQFIIARCGRFRRLPFRRCSAARESPRHRGRPRWQLFLGAPPRQFPSQCDRSGTAARPPA